MTVLSRLQRKPTGTDKPYGWTTFKLLREETGNTRPTIDRCTEYLLVGQLETRFWANKAQLPLAQHDAEKMLALTIYGDFMLLIAEARGAVWAGDPTAVLHALNRMEQEVLGNGD
jgi:hypothetical protein